MFTWLLSAMLIYSTLIRPCDSNVYNLYTNPETKEGDVTLINCAEGEVNVTIFCYVEKNSIQLATQWYIQRFDLESKPVSIIRKKGLIIEPEGLQNNIVISGETVWNYVTFSTNFTILDFTKVYHASTIQCGTTGNIRRTFMLGIPTAPIIKNVCVRQVVQEGSTKNISLEVLNKPFPPIIMTYWTFNGQNTTSSDVISYEDYRLLIYKAQKNMKGNYTLTVLTSRDLIQKSFFLDVQYAPQVEPMGGLERTSVTKKAALVAFKILDVGNPHLNVSWTGPKGKLDISLPGKFSALILGQLIVYDVSIEDNGTYVCTLGNGIEKNTNFTVDLMVEPYIPTEHNDSLSIYYTLSTSSVAPTETSIKYDIGSKGVLSLTTLFTITGAMVIGAVCLFIIFIIWIVLKRRSKKGIHQEKKKMTSLETPIKTTSNIVYGKFDRLNTKQNSAYGFIV